MKTNFILFGLLLIMSCKQSTPKEAELDTEKKESKILFTQLTSAETGIDFINKNIENSKINYYKYEYYYNGSGVAVADINNDGLQDIYFAANMATSKLFLNKGDLKFEDISETAGIDFEELEWCTGANFIDVNNDGFQDILVSRSGWWKGKFSDKLRNLLYINNGDLTFTEKGLEYGFSDLSHTTQSCFFDFDNDGDLDVYFLNHSILFDKADILNPSKEKNSEAYRYSDKLYRNDNGFFTDITLSSEVFNYGNGLGIIASDFNNDGWQDLFVANDFKEPDYIYINQKNGKFKNEINTAFKHMSKFSMGVDVADINNDGFQDIFVAEMLAPDNYSKKANMAAMNPKLYNGLVEDGYHYQDMHNCMHLNNGNGTFSEIAWLANIAETGWTWSPLFADFNNDGFKDLFLTNGFKRDVINKDFSMKEGTILKNDANQFDLLKNKIPMSKSNNFVFKNNGDLSFEDKSLEWGLSMSVNANGSAYADFDNDGDLDLVTNNINDQAHFYRNNSQKTNYVSFDLKKNNVSNYGAKVEILDQSNYQISELTNVNGYQSKSENKIHFGLGEKTSIDSVLVTWANGKKTFLKDVEINVKHSLNYEKVNFVSEFFNKKPKRFFNDKTDEIALDYVHQENEFDDYKYEILLPHKLSQEGAFVDVADVNGDGLDDFYVGGGVGFSGKLYLQNTKGKFDHLVNRNFEIDKESEDLAILFFDYDSDGDKDLYVVSGSNEFKENAKQYQDRLYQNDGKGNFTKTIGVIPEMHTSSSCVKTADFDNDGDLDLFIGGFLVAQKYPKPGVSYLLENVNGKFVNKTEVLANGLSKIGMVKDACFADLNNDNKLDLIVLGQWMAVQVFINNGKQFENKTKEYNLADYTGWWNSLKVEDVNNDGFKDIIAGNLGLNTKHKASASEAFEIYAKDFDNNGTNDIVLGYYNGGTLFPVRGKQCSLEQVPSLSNNIKSYSQFGFSNLENVYGKENLESALHLKATHFETSIFINQAGKNFSIKSLPNEFQFSPVNDILAIDLNKDNSNEFLMIGNLYPVEVETGRYDASTGAILSFDDNGNAQSINNTSAGFFINKDAKCIKKIIINKKTYLIISSNRDKLTFLELNE